MGVGMCLYAQLVQTKNTWCKSAINNTMCIYLTSVPDTLLASVNSQWSFAFFRPRQTDFVIHLWAIQCR